MTYLVTLVGPLGSGTSEFAYANFPPAQVFSVGDFREICCGDRNNLAATPSAQTILRMVLGDRMRFRLPTVLDIADASEHERREATRGSRGNGVRTVAVVFRTPLHQCLERITDLGQAAKRDAVRAGHARISAELRYGLPAYGYDATVWLMPKGPRYLGVLPGELATRPWLAGTQRVDTSKAQEEEKVA